MSISGILSSSLLNFNTPGIQDRMQQFRKDFQQLGQDLQTGNLSGAQADFAAMQKDGPQSSSAQSSNPIAQAIQQLSTDLQSGNLTGAQQDYSNRQQDFQNPASPMQRPHHHHRNHSGADRIRPSRKCCRSWDRTCSRATWRRRRRPTVRCSRSAAVRDRERGARWDGFDDGGRQRVSGESSSIAAPRLVGKAEKLLTAKTAKKDRKGR